MFGGDTVRTYQQNFGLDRDTSVQVLFESDTLFDLVRIPYPSGLVGYYGTGGSFSAPVVSADSVSLQYTIPSYDNDPAHFPYVGWSLLLTDAAIAGDAGIRHDLAGMRKIRITYRAYCDFYLTFPQSNINDGNTYRILIAGSAGWNTREIDPAAFVPRQAPQTIPFSAALSNGIFIQTNDASTGGPLAGLLEIKELTPLF